MNAFRRALLCAGLLVAAGCGPPEGSDIVTLARMELWLGSSAEPPASGSAGWRMADMPDHWPLRRRWRGLEGWYRAHVELPFERSAADPVALYLPGFSGHVVAYWDGQRLGDNGPYIRDDTRHVRGPLLLQIPDTWVASGDHVVHLRFRVTEAMPGYLLAPIVGPRARLMAAYEQKLAFSRQLPVVVAWAGGIVSLLLLLAYWRDPELSAVAWVSAGLFLNSVALAGIYTSYALLVLPARVFEPLRPALFHFSLLFFVFALHRLRNLDRRRLERWLLGIWSAFALLIFAVPLILSYAVAVLWGIPTVALSVYLVALIVGTARTLSAARAAGALVPLAGAGFFLAHDLVGSVSGRFPLDQILTIYTCGMITLALVGMLITRTRVALQESHSLNRELDARVAEKGAELARNFERLRVVEREQVLLAERERILRDMHDGLGGQLVSTLAMVESGRFQADELAEALRDGLDDLRLMVHSLDPAQSDLLSMLAVVRERLEPRLSRRGLRFEWRVEDVPDLPALEPAGVLQVLRIVQEVITNIVRHADASTIFLETGTSPVGAPTAYVFLSIRDDGVGLPSVPRRGRGLGNIRERARRVGAELEIVSPAKSGVGSGGTRVTLRFPLG